MRFSLTTLSLVLAPLFLATNAYVLSISFLRDDGTLRSMLWDNYENRCMSEVRYTRNSQIYLSCNPNFYSWVQISSANPPGFVQAYAYNGMNFKWDIPASRSPNGWSFEKCLFGCNNLAAVQAMKKIDALTFTGKETEDEMRTMVSAAINGKEVKAFTA